MLLRATFIGLALSLVSLQVLSDTSEHYESALQAFNNGENETAYIHLKNSLSDDPDNLAAKILMGRVLLKEGYLEEAKTELQESLQMGADLNLVIEPLGDTLMLQQDFDAIVALPSSNKLTTANRYYYTVLKASALARLGKPDASRQLFRQAINLNPEGSIAQQRLIDLEISYKDLDAAQQLLNNELKRLPDNARLWQLQGRVYRLQNQLSQAKQSFERAHQLSSEDPLISRALADIYIATDDRTSATKIINKILQSTPNDPVALLFQSWLQSNSEAQQDAELALQKVSGILSGLDNDALKEDPLLVYVAGLTAYAKGQFQQARGHLASFVQQHPTHLNASVMLARTYMQLERDDDALNLLDPLGKALTEDVNASVLLAELYLKNNRTFKAIQTYDRLAERYPNRIEVALLNVQILAARDRFDEAITQLDRLQSAISAAQFYRIKTLTLLNANRHPQALVSAEQLIAAHPDNADNVNLKSGILISLGQYQQALSFAQQALTLAPEHFSAQYNYAFALLNNGDSQQAEERLRSLAEQQPDNLRVQLALATAQVRNNKVSDAQQRLEAVIQSDPANVKGLQLLADLHQYQQQYDIALRYINQLLKLQGDIPPLLLKKAKLYQLKGAIDVANYQYSRLETIAQDDPATLMALSRIRQENGDLKGALSSINAAYQLSPQNKAIGLQLIGLALATDDLPLAEKVYTELSKHHEADPAMQLRLATISAAKGEPEKAAKLYSQIMSQPDVSQGDATKRLATIYFYQLTLRNLVTEQFEQTAQAVLTRDPENHFVRNLLADFYLNQQQRNKALAQYQQLSQLTDYDNLPIVLNNLANLVLADNISQARELIERAAELSPNHPAILDTIGWIATQQQRYEEGLTMLRKAYALDSTNPAIQYHLAYTLNALERPDEARASLQRLLATYPEFEERADAQALLKRLSTAGS